MYTNEMRLNPFKRTRSRSRSKAPHVSWISPETKRAVIGVVFIVFSLIVVLSFFSAAGPTGALLLSSLRRLFGITAFVLPFALAVGGWYLIRPREEPLPRLRIIAMALASFGLLGVLHSVPGMVPSEDALQYALDGDGGGLVGFSLAWPLRKAFSDIAAFLIFLATALVGVFLAFDTSPQRVWEYLRSFVPAKGDDEEYDDEESSDEEQEPEDASDEPAAMPMFRISRMSRGAPDPNQLELQQQKAEEEQKKRLRQQLSSANKKYEPPRLDLLHSSVGKPDSGNVEENKEKIKSTLEEFGIPVTMRKVFIGPTVTQYTLIPEQGIKLARIMALQNDLALALAAHPIRIEAPIPRTSLVGIEIPNKSVSLVRLKDLISSKEFRKAPSPLTIAMGQDVAGRTRVATIESMPHMLIAGATGSGKSIFINTLIVSLLYRNSPAVVRFLMVDPKRVELSLYNGIPHLLNPVITEPDKTINALKWAVREMDRRYRLLAESGARSLMSYNANNPDKAMPMIVIIIDELADLMATHARDVEGAIVRLAQMARAIGIHLVLATQRPSVNVITGLIKANVPSRAAFNVASQVDSRTILDGAGAEKLLGSGDMLYLASDQGKPVRLQSGYISEEEVRSVVKDLVENNEIDENQYDPEITEPTRETVGHGSDGADDAMFEDAKRVVIESGKASTSLLQRRLRVGYSRAARLMDMLEERGLIGGAEGNKPREVLAEFESEEFPPTAVAVDEDEPYESSEEYDA
jgi:DNA segregation ATPase FtsK/SpoIIIE, S-DNA-T family